ncbi:hypothetical protein UlMin_019062 [Ulmus minor]
MSWRSYVQALASTTRRLKDRLLKILNWWDLMWFGVGSIMGAGIFVLTGEAARNESGPAVVVSYFISGISAMLSAGGLFSYLRVELGDFVAYIAAGNILSEYMVSGASVAWSWTSYFATLFASLAKNCNHLDPIAVAVSVAVCVGASLSMKGSSRLNLFAAIVICLTKPDPTNMTNFAPYGIRGILKASSVLFFAYVGFDGMATLGEEVKIPAYCVLAATLCLMQPFSVAFQAAGMDWAKYIVAIGALKGMTTVLQDNLIGQARYFTHIARTHMAPPILAAINKRTGTPVNAMVIMTIANSIIVLFTSLEVLANLLSVSTLFIFSLVSAALIVRRNKLLAFLALIIGSSTGSAVYWKASKKGWIGYVVTVMIWFLATLSLKLTVKEARKPKKLGVPLVPWLPSASIAINVFIMGSIDGPSFLRLILWMILLLAYYLVVTLHASYDATKLRWTKDQLLLLEQ